MYAPRAKFERIYVISPIKVAVVLLTSLHCLCLLIAFSTSFWLKTKTGHYGPLFSCEKILITNNSLILSMKNECYMRGFIRDINLMKIPLISLLIMSSFLFAFISMITASLSFVEMSYFMRQRYWSATNILLFFTCITDWYILTFIPMSYYDQIYYLQWAYGIHCIATLLISLSFIIALLMHNTDDIRYIEGVETCSIKNQTKH